MEDGLSRRIASSSPTVPARLIESAHHDGSGVSESASPARSGYEKARPRADAPLPATDSVGPVPASAEAETSPDNHYAGAGDDEAPEWPDETVEAAMIAEQRERNDDAPPSPRAPRPTREAGADEDAAEPLPKLDALIEKIPPDVRETLDELFRARFTSVQRVPKHALKE